MLRWVMLRIGGCGPPSVMLRMTAPASGSDKCELPVNGKVDWQFAFIKAQ